MRIRRNLVSLAVYLLGIIQTLTLTFMGVHCTGPLPWGVVVERQTLVTVRAGRVVFTFTFPTPTIISAG